jgi:hypothetical protein
MALDKKKVKKNRIRTLSNGILKFLKLNGFTNTCIGLCYMVYHYFFMGIGAFIVLFNVNLRHLLYTLIFVAIDAFAIVVLHNCPLTHLEQKYLNTNLVEERSQIFKNCGIVYQCEHEYEKQIELLINVSLFIVMKCLILISLNTFHIQLHNHKNLYV